MNTTVASVSFTEFEQMPDEPGKQELIDGEVIYLPPPKLRHTELVIRLLDLFRTAFSNARVLPEAGYRIGGGWLQPDLSVTWPDQRRDTDYLIGGPMFAIEVLSPSNTADYVERKLALYLSEGAGEVWVVNDRRKSVTVYYEDRVVRLSAKDTYTSRLATVTVSVAELLA
jgi:Uma2 family endonuclease